MKTPHVWLFVALAVGLVTGCESGAAKWHECPDAPTITCKYDGGTATVNRWDDYRGRVIERGIFTYDADGNLLTWELDEHANDTVDVRATYTYDSNGNRLTWEIDSDADGSLEKRRTYTYDDDGSRLSVYVDNFDRGSSDWRCTYDPACPPEVHRDPEAHCAGLGCARAR